MMKTKLIPFKKTGVLALFFVLLVTVLPATAQKSDPDKIYDAAQKPAEPKGGMQAFQTYLSENLTYPTESLRKKVQGIVYVDFIVEKNGSISNVAVKKGLDEDTDKESIRVISASPKWEPAYNRGEKVRFRVTVPLVFKIPEGYATTTDTTTAEQETKQTTGKAVENFNTSLKEVTPEEPARPVNGLEAFNADIQKNLNYPKKAKKKGAQGKVLVEFVVERDGSLSEEKVIKGIGHGCDEEALRLIKKSPKWSPAMYKGQPIRQKIILPVIFQL